VANITVTVPDDVYKAARICAAAQGSSVDALVAAYLSSLSDIEFHQREAEQARIIAQMERFSAGERLDRDEIHMRAIRCEHELPKT
jgi:ribosomal protein L1